MQARTTNAVQPIVVFLSFRHNAIHDVLNKKKEKIDYSFSQSSESAILGVVAVCPHEKI